MTFWIAAVIVGFVTIFLFRGGFILFKQSIAFPKIIDEFLDYIPISAMFAIAATHIIFIQNDQILTFAPDKILAGFIALIAALLSKNLFVTLTTGMVAYWIIQYCLALIA